MLVAALIAVGAGGYAAASSGSSPTVTACAKKSNGALRLAKKCKKSEKPVSWSVQGPTGPTGATGAAGADGVSLFARVDETGALHQHSPGVTVTKNANYAGIYYVKFSEDISACVPVVSATQASNNGYTPGVLYEAKVMSDPNNTNDPHTVQVYAYDGTSPYTVHNAPFALVVAC
ncbi:MAG: hypothetical protein QM572_02750 [Nocardioides sp.]|uniref:hypothetical protein n=1 Tax=Nocardioides sp. TaxID=35761 RepID=UPI0039E28EE0